MERKKITDITYQISCLLLVAGAALGYSPAWWAKLLLAIGAAGYLLTFMLVSPLGLDMRTRRLYRMNFLAGLLFGVSAYFRYMGRGQMEWLLFFAIGLVFMIYASIFLMRRQNKNQTDGKY